MPKQDQFAVEEHLKFARHLHIETRILEGDDLAEAVVAFGHGNQITHIVLSRRDHRWWIGPLRTDPILRIVQKAPDIRVIIGRTEETYLVYLCLCSPREICMRSKSLLQFSGNVKASSPL